MKEDRRTNSKHRYFSRFFGAYLLVALAAAIFLFCPVVQAASLDIEPGIPDILTGYLDVNYYADDDLLVVDGWALTLDDDGSVPPENITNGLYSISASIDGSGNLGTGGGTLSIGGTVPSLGFISTPLLTGILTDFGYPGGGSDVLEFLFEVTGGDAAELYGGVGATGGIIVENGTGFSGSFAVDWDNNSGMPGYGFGTATSDNFANTVPIPGALWLLGSGLIGLMGIRRRFKKN